MNENNNNNSNNDEKIKRLKKENERLKSFSQKNGELISRLLSREPDYSVKDIDYIRIGVIFNPQNIFKISMMVYKNKNIYKFFQKFLEEYPLFIVVFLERFNYLDKNIKLAEKKLLKLSKIAINSYSKKKNTQNYSGTEDNFKDFVQKLLTTKIFNFELAKLIIPHLPEVIFYENFPEKLFNNMFLLKLALMYDWKLFGRFPDEKKNDLNFIKKLLLDKQGGRVSDKILQFVPKKISNELYTQQLGSTGILNSINSNSRLNQNYEERIKSRKYNSTSRKQFPRRVKQQLRNYLGIDNITFIERKLNDMGITKFKRDDIAKILKEVKGDTLLAIQTLLQKKINHNSNNNNSNNNNFGGSQFINVPKYGKRKIRYRKNGRAYVIYNNKKHNL